MSAQEIPQCPKCGVEAPFDIRIYLEKISIATLNPDGIVRDEETDYECVVEIHCAECNANLDPIIVKDYE